MVKSLNQHRVRHARTCAAVLNCVCARVELAVHSPLHPVMLTLSQRLLAASACCAQRHIKLATWAALAGARGDATGPPVHDDPHWGPLDVPDEPPEVILIEEQHGQPEPPSQKPPMWFIQVWGP